MGLLYLFINTLSHNMGTLNSWNPLGHYKPVMGLLYLFINTLLHNLGTLTSWNPLGHSRPVIGLLYLLLSLYTEHGRAVFLQSLLSPYSQY